MSAVRTVPYIYKNSNGEPDWTSGVSYEVLTIVKYNNRYYTSKQDVPSNVTNPAENPTYWSPCDVYESTTSAGGVSSWLFDWRCKL